MTLVLWVVRADCVNGEIDDGRMDSFWTGSILKVDQK